MNCQEMQDWMANDFPGFLGDPVAQAHLASCPDCREVFAEEQLVRAALATYAWPDPDEALLARLRSIPERYPRQATADGPARQASWPLRQGRRLLARLAMLRPQRRTESVGRGPRPAADRRQSPPAPPSRLAPLFLAGAATAVALAVAFLVWPRGGAPRMGHATVTPTPSPAAPPLSTGTPAGAAALQAAATAATAATEDAALSPTAAADAAPSLFDPSRPFANAHWDAAAPAAIGAVKGLTVQDFCVLPDAGLVLFITHQTKGGTREEQLAARDDQRVLQLPLGALRPGAEAVEPRVFADFGDLPGSEEAGLDAIDCAATGGRVLVTRRNLWRMARATTWTGDLWLLDGTGVRLNKENLLWEADEATAAAALAPDGRAALVLDEGQQTVHVLRLDAPPGPDFAADDTHTGVGLTLPSGEPGGIMRWSPDGRTFLLGSIQAEGTDVDVFRWDGRQAERMLHTRAYRQESAPPAADAAAADVPVLPWPGLRGRLDPASLQVTDAGALLWLQWVDDAASAGAPEADGTKVEDAAQIMAWSPDAAGGSFRDGAAATLVQVTLPRADDGGDRDRQLSLLLRRTDTSWLLAEDDGHVWRLRSAGGAVELAPLLLAGRRLALLPAADGADHLVYQKPDPMAAADRDTAIPFRPTDWLGALALPRP